jgi:hypothetical protein
VYLLNFVQLCDCILCADGSICDYSTGKGLLSDERDRRILGHIGAFAEVKKDESLVLNTVIWIPVILSINNLLSSHKKMLIGYNYHINT